uniref:Serpin domain-containing protein n=1 Tax=Panagrolaimus sp. ES5 TaxID=591445 RepID=A0AC34GPB3_9BILA
MSDNLSHETMSQAMVNAQADFALNLLRDSGVNSSTILSPISISIALAMVYLGAKENTATQIRNTIAKDASEEEIHAHFSSVLSLINSNDLNVTLESANRVYLQNNFKLLDTYVEGIKKHYAGELEEIDFGQASAAASKINGFVEKATHDKIKNLISADSINDLTRLILINAIYFKGDWDKQFKEENTRDADFYSSPDNTKKVKMMSLESKFPYYENENYQVLGLPYKSKQVSMYIILPRERFGLEKVVKEMNATTLTELLGKKGSTTVKVQLPRFKIESSFQLVDTLKKLGITEAFADNANFTGISEEGDLKVSEVIHKAFIETNEKGSEAAASSAAIVTTRMRPSKPPVIPTFVAEHSFLYVIENNNQNILFIGKYFA